MENAGGDVLARDLHRRWFIIDVLTLGPDWALEIVAWSSPGDLAECLGPGWQMVGGFKHRPCGWMFFWRFRLKS